MEWEKFIARGIPRLGRSVAVKVLPENFATDAERLQRFEREAQALSTLNDPNVLAIFDVGSQNGTHYLVSELLEGKTLREQSAAAAKDQRVRAGNCEGARGSTREGRHSPGLEAGEHLQLDVERHRCLRNWDRHQLAGRVEECGRSPKVGIANLSLPLLCYSPITLMRSEE